MNIIAVGMNHKTAPLEVRERFAFKQEQLKDILNELKSLDSVIECMLLSTCNRVESYVVASEENIEQIKNFLLEKYSPPSEDRQRISDMLYAFKNEKAVEHICCVSAGLDSMVIGEPQVFGQVKEAFALADDAGAIGPVFRSLFLRVFSLVKKVRTLTEIGRNNLSVSHVAVSLAKKIFEDTKGCNVLVLGAGEMAELAVRALRGQGAGSLFITNRTFERAVALAKALDGIPIMLYEIADYLHSVDILISSVSSEGYAIGRGEIEKTLSERGGRPLIIIDISVPRSVDPDVSRLENVHLYNIDDLTSIAEANLSSRLTEANKAEAIIKDRARKILKKLDTDGIISDIVAMRNAAEEIRRSELEKFLSSGGLPEDERDRLDAFSRSVMNKILHQAIEKMREHAGYMRFK